MSSPAHKLSPVTIAPNQVAALLTTRDGRETSRLIRLARRILKGGLFYVYQRKYGIECETGCTRFQRWYHHHVWLPFARFSRRRIGVPIGDGADKNGDVFFIEHEGFVIEEWQAEEVIRRYKSGGFHRLPLLKMLTSDNIPRSETVVQTNGKRYCSKPGPCAHSRRLADSISATDAVIAEFSSDV